MTMAVWDTTIGAIKRLACSRRLEESSDRDLLQSFASMHDEAAFAEIVRRHGPLVDGVCRRVLRGSADVDDAFQATFLILTRKAGSISWHSTVGPWLHATALRVAMKVRGRKARLACRERSLTVDTQAIEIEMNEELNETIDAEICRLPGRYASIVSLCCLQERTTEEAARELGISEGAARARLYRGRALLRKRLGERGIAVPAVIVFAASASVSSAKANNVARRALAFFRQGGNSADPSTIIAREVLNSMYWNNVKLCAGMSVCLVMAAVGVTMLAAGGPAQRPPADRQLVRHLDEEEGEKPEKPVIEGAIASYSETDRVLVVRTEFDDVEKDVSLVLDPKATLTFGGKPVSTAQIKPGMVARAELTPNRERITSMTVAWPSINSKVTAIDASARTVTIADEDDDDKESTRSLTLETDVAVRLDQFEAGLDDIEPGQTCKFKWNIDKSRIQAVDVAGQRGFPIGRVASADGEKRLLVVTFEIGGDDGDERKVDLAFDVAKTAPVKLTGKLSSLSELKTGMRVRLGLNADRRTVERVWAAIPPTEKEDD